MIISQKEELINALLSYYKKHKKKPSAVRFQNDKNYPHPSKYIKIFGSWSNALKEAKLQPRIINFRKPNKESQ